MKISDISNQSFTPATTDHTEGSKRGQKMMFGMFGGQKTVPAPSTPMTANPTNSAVFQEVHEPQKGGRGLFPNRFGLFKRWDPNAMQNRFENMGKAYEERVNQFNQGKTGGLWGPFTSFAFKNFDYPSGNESNRQPGLAASPYNPLKLAAQQTGLNGQPLAGQSHFGAWLAELQRSQQNQNVATGVPIPFSSPQEVEALEKELEELTRKTEGSDGSQPNRQGQPVAVQAQNPFASRADQIGSQPNRQGQPVAVQAQNPFALRADQIGLQPNRQGQPVAVQAQNPFASRADQIGLQPNRQGQPIAVQAQNPFASRADQIGLQPNRQGQPVAVQAQNPFASRAGQIGLQPNRQGQPIAVQAQNPFASRADQIGTQPNRQGQNVTTGIPISYNVPISLSNPEEYDALENHLEELMRELEASGGSQPSRQGQPVAVQAQNPFAPAANQAGLQPASAARPASTSSQSTVETRSPQERINSAGSAYSRLESQIRQQLGVQKYEVEAKVAEKISTAEDRISRVSKVLNARLDSINKRTATLETRVHKQIELINAKRDDLKNKMEPLRVAMMENRTITAKKTYENAQKARMVWTNQISELEAKLSALNENNDLRRTRAFTEAEMYTAKQTKAIADAKQEHKQKLSDLDAWYENSINSAKDRIAEEFGVAFRSRQ
jgi:tetrahydromethanopterin S-methyltransferase subunit G